MVKYPMHFRGHADAEAGIQNLWTAQAETLPDHRLTLAIPPEFEGPGGGLSPEDLYLLALENCFVATFKVFAEKSRLQFKNLEVQGELTVDRDAQGRPWMAKVHLKVTLFECPQQDLAQRLLERVSGSCLILNSVKTEKTFEYQYA